MDSNQERAAVKEVFAKYREHERLLSSPIPAALPPEGVQLMLVFDGNAIQYQDAPVIHRAEAKQYNRRVKECVYQLTKLERDIITASYMGKYLIPWRIYEPMGLSRTVFYTTKDKAINKLFLLFRMNKLINSSDF